MQLHVLSRIRASMIEALRHAMRHDLHWLNMTDRIQFRIAVTVYSCLHGIAPEYLSDYCSFLHQLARLGTVSDLPTVTSSSCRQSNSLHTDGVLLMYHGQLFGTASRNISGPAHYPLTRLGGISKQTFCALLIYTPRLSGLCDCVRYTNFYCDCEKSFWYYHRGIAIARVRPVHLMNNSAKRPPTVRSSLPTEPVNLPESCCSLRPPSPFIQHSLIYHVLLPNIVDTIFAATAALS